MKSGTIRRIVTRLQFAKFLCELFLTHAKLHSTEFTLEDMKVLHLFLFKKVVKLWLSGSKKDCKKQGLENSPITDSCDTVRCALANWISRVYLCDCHNGGTH
jgi:hypothetical protein